MEQKQSDSPFEEILKNGRKLMADNCKCGVCQEHDPEMKRISNTERRHLAIFALFLICLSSWVAYQTGSMNATTKLQQEAVKRGHAFYQPREVPAAFKWKE